jgi:hypothetical protein
MDCYFYIGCHSCNGLKFQSRRLGSFVATDFNPLKIKNIKIHKHPSHLRYLWLKNLPECIAISLLDVMHATDFNPRAVGSGLL